MYSNNMAQAQPYQYMQTAQTQQAYPQFAAPQFAKVASKGGIARLKENSEKKPHLKRRH